MTRPSMLESLFRGVRRLLAGAPEEHANEAPLTAIRLAHRDENAETRIMPRVQLGLQALLRMHGQDPVSCVVVDATTEGVRISTGQVIHPGTFADIEIPFNGQKMRAGLRVMWSDVTSGKFTLGAQLLSDRSGESILRDFARYLRWRSSLRKRAA